MNDDSSGELPVMTRVIKLGPLIVPDGPQYADMTPERAEEIIAGATAEEADRRFRSYLRTKKHDRVVLTLHSSRCFAFARTLMVALRCGASFIR